MRHRYAEKHHQPPAQPCESHPARRSRLWTTPGKPMSIPDDSDSADAFRRGAAPAHQTCPRCGSSVRGFWAVPASSAMTNLHCLCPPLIAYSGKAVGTGQPDTAYGRAFFFSRINPFQLTQQCTYTSFSSSGCQASLHWNQAEARLWCTALCGTMAVTGYGEPDSI